MLKILLLSNIKIHFIGDFLLFHRVRSELQDLRDLTEPLERRCG